jgi:hypothetical protein
MLNDCLFNLSDPCLYANVVFRLYFHLYYISLAGTDQSDPGALPLNQSNLGVQRWARHGLGRVS